MDFDIQKEWNSLILPFPSSGSEFFRLNHIRFLYFTIDPNRKESTASNTEKHTCTHRWTHITERTHLWKVPREA